MKTVILSDEAFEVICEALRNEISADTYYVNDPLNGPEDGSDEQREHLDAIAARNRALEQLHTSSEIK